jgi:hypothetical protein
MLWPSDLIYCFICTSSNRQRSMAEEEYYLEV